MYIVVPRCLFLALPPVACFQLWCLFLALPPVACFQLYLKLLKPKYVTALCGLPWSPVVSRSLPWSPVVSRALPHGLPHGLPWCPMFSHSLALSTVAFSVYFSFRLLCCLLPQRISFGSQVIFLLAATVSFNFLRYCHPRIPLGLIDNNICIAFIIIHLLQ